MPLLTVTTNIDANSSDVVSALSKAVATLTGKPESYVAVILIKSDGMSFGGTEAPCAMMKLESIGAIKGQQSKLASALTETASKFLNISARRIYINFEDVPASNWALNGSTFG
ncbi:hypothetical protein ACOME3_007309 [Neoechinorhynchus agilis]